MLLRKFIGIIIMSLLVTGCWDRREIEERLLVAAIGVDSTEKGDGVTFQVPIPNQIVGSSGSGGSTQSGGNNGTIQFHAEAKTLTEAIKKVRIQATQEPFLGYTQMLLIGEGKAKKGILDFLEGIRQHPEFRRQFWPVVVKGEAEKILNLSLKIDPINSMVIRRNIENGVRRGRFPDVTLKDLLLDLSNPIKRNPILNVVQADGEDKIEWKGVAVFNHDRMIGILDENESDAITQIRGKQAGRYLVLPCTKGGGAVGFRPSKVRRKIHVTEKPSITIDMYVKGALRESSCYNYIRKGKSANRIGKMIEQWYTRNGQRLIDRAQKQDQIDYLLLGEYIQSYHTNIWKKLNWKKDFPHIPIQVRYHVNIDQLGITLP